MRIFLTDDQRQIRYGLRVLLEQQPGWQVTGEAASGGELLAQFETANTDVVLLDWHLADMDGGCLLTELHRISPNTTVIVLSGQLDIKAAAMEAGADAFVSKASPPNQLIEIMRSIKNNKKKE